MRSTVSTILLALILAGVYAGQTDNDTRFAASSPSDLIKRRGFFAEDHYLTTPDGHILNLVRATNPLVNEGVAGAPNKDPILFVHGINTNANCFVINSEHVTPKDYSHLSAGSMSELELRYLLEPDPCSHSLAFTAMNFGHEIWLLNRRGTSYSLGFKDTQIEPLTSRFGSFYQTFGFKSHTNGSTRRNSKLLKSLFLPKIYSEKLQLLFNPRFWNYSLDEQAIYDIPLTIDLVLAHTGRDKLAYVGHSAGGALSLMALSEDPSLSKKISKLILWAPAMDLSGTSDQSRLSQLALKSANRLSKYLGPVPPMFFKQPVDFKTPLCNHAWARDTICRMFIDLTFGSGSSQLDLSSDAVVQLFDPISSHELISLMQSIKSGAMRKYDYKDKSKNLIAYGRARPPIYNVSAIELNSSVSIWYGLSDTLVTEKGVDKLAENLKVRVEKHPLSGNGTLFNHISFFLHKNVSRLLVIPGIKALESI